MEPDTVHTTEPIVTHKKEWSFVKKAKWVGISAVLLAIVIFLTATIGVNKLRSLRATSEAKDYVSELYPGYQVEGSVCQGEDTDSDKYVSCDLHIKNATESRIINIQCPTIVKSFLGTSCKQTRPVLGQ